jgi:hypothetical protein
VSARNGRLISKRSQPLISVPELLAGSFVWGKSQDCIGFSERANAKVAVRLRARDGIARSAAADRPPEALSALQAALGR